MLAFIIRRLLTLIPGLLLLSGVVFWLGKAVEDSPVLRNLAASIARAADDDPAAYQIAYRETAGQLGLDKPVFYFSISPATYPDTFYRIVQPEQKEVLTTLLNEYGNWPAIQTYYQRLSQLGYQRSDSVGVLARELLLRQSKKRIESGLATLNDPEIIDAWEQVAKSSAPLASLLPAFHWHGLDNQYHRWLANIVSGDFGTSTLDRRKVEDKIWPALRWTALINGIAIFLAYLISIPVGMYSAWFSSSKGDRFLNTFFLLLFSLPAFWMASIFSTYLTNPALGIDLFPTVGVGDVAPDASWWTYLSTRAYYLFLPVFCLTYPSLAFLTRQVRAATKDELNKTYVKLAKMKGLSDHQIIWKEVFRNASFPLITLLASLLPGLLAGSVLIEIIFNLPGMGRLLVNSTIGSDWPVVMMITLLNGLLTVIGLLLADLGYALADPRVRLGQQTPRS